MGLTAQEETHALARYILLFRQMMSVEFHSPTRTTRSDVSKKNPYPNPRLGTAKARSAYVLILTVGLKVLRLGRDTLLSPPRTYNCYSFPSLFVYCQVQQLSNHFWDRGRSNRISCEPKLSQIKQLPEGLWNGANFIFTKIKLFQIRQLPKRFWDGTNFIFTEVKQFQVGQLPKRFWDGANLIITEKKQFQVG